MCFHCHTEIQTESEDLLEEGERGKKRKRNDDCNGSPNHKHVVFAVVPPHYTSYALYVHDAL